MKSYSEYTLAGVLLVIIAQAAFHVGSLGFGYRALVAGIQATIPILVAFAQLSLVAFVILYSFFRSHHAVSGVLSELARSGRELALIVAATAMFGSLFYSQVLGLVPCEMCWFQRIFLYPLTFIIGVAVFRRKGAVFEFVLPLCVIGSLFSLYHYGLQFTSIFTSNCVSTCGQKLFAYFGYMTIPMMALTASVTIAVLLYLDHKSGPA